MGGIVVVLLREHGMLWNTGGKKIKLNILCACIGFGRCMDLVSAWGRWDAWCE